MSQVKAIKWPSVSLNRVQGRKGNQIRHCVNNFLGFYSIILKLGTKKELVILKNAFFRAQFIKA